MSRPSGECRREVVVVVVVGLYSTIQVRYYPDPRFLFILAYLDLKTGVH